MKKLLLVVAVFCAYMSQSQVSTIWSENFGTSPSPCGTLAAHNANPGNGLWTVVNSGTNDLLANEWYISAREAGMGVGNCGNGCLSNSLLANRSLHISTHQSLFGDIGAAYSAGPGVSNTNKRAQSPTINCSGKTGITLHFNYLMWGVVNQDFCQVQYSGDNGVTWSSLGIPAQTPTVSCAGQGLWTSYSVALPASANNNPTVKIGFRWQNVSNSGADPSVAIDDIEVKGISSSTLNPTFTITNTACQGYSTTLTANTGTASVSGYTWSASPTGPAISPPNSSVTLIYFPNPGTYSVTLTVSSGTQVASVTNIIFIAPNPTVNASASSNTICAGSQVTLNANGAITYTWSPGSLTGSSVAVSPSVSTNYFVVGTGSFGCTGSAVVNVSVFPNPTVSISANTLVVCIGSSAVLTASGAATYSWMPGSATGNTLLVTPTVNTTYTLMGANANGCSSTATIAITATNCSTTRLNDLVIESIFNIYPNPVKNKLHITTGKNMEHVNIKISDLQGRTIFVQTIQRIKADEVLFISLEKIEAGVYIAEFISEKNERQTHRLIKE